MNNVTQIGFLKDMILQLQEDRKMMDDINWLRKKVEMLTSSMSVMKSPETQLNPIGSISPKRAGPLIDASKFVDQFQFGEFQKLIQKEYENNKRLTEEIKRYVDDLIECNKKKADEKDLKNLEEFLGGKIDEIKINFLKKFADKSETVKNLKFLDTQLKFVLDNNTKKDKGGDNWLIAKKPMGGYECASCESYIGNLPNNTQNNIVNWNKYPQRDISDKAYRVIKNI